MSDIHDHTKCPLKDKRYNTCWTIWDKAKLLALKIKIKRKLKSFSVYELLDELILTKEKEV